MRELTKAEKDKIAGFVNGIQMNRPGFGYTDLWKYVESLLNEQKPADELPKVAKPELDPDIES